MLERVTLERRATAPFWLSVATYLGAVLFALGLSLIILTATGVPRDALFQELVMEVFFDRDGLARTLTAATPMILVGLSAALCLRLKFWNIGIEGQLLLGGIFATTVALYDIGGAMRLPVMMLAAAAGGALWIALPLLLRLRLGVSEVIVTLLLSKVAFLLLQHMVFGPFRDPTHNFPSSPVLDAVERLPRLGFGNVHAGLFLALAAAGLCGLMVHRLRFGFAANLTGDNPDAARSLGFPTVRIMVVVILLGGAMAGLAGGVVVAGTEYRLTQQIGLFATFNGIVVAALARNEPLAVPLVAFLLAGLAVASGSLKVFYGVSEGIILTIKGVILLSLVTAQFFTTFRVTLDRTGTTERAA
ncbi:MAG: ABC transporter permease [Rhodobacteraceae bacterium]|nr:ABC transporter permease [Paracoccaceae bacterium]